MEDHRRSGTAQGYPGRNNRRDGRGNRKHSSGSMGQINEGAYHLPREVPVLGMCLVVEPLSISGRRLESGKEDNCLQSSCCRRRSYTSPGSHRGADCPRNIERTWRLHSRHPFSLSSCPLEYLGGGQIFHGSDAVVVAGGQLPETLHPEGLPLPGTAILATYKAGHTAAP